MTDVQATLASAQAIPHNTVVHGRSKECESFEKTNERVQAEDVKHPDESKISHGIPNAYADKVKNALMKVCGAKSAEQLQELMKLAQKNPSQSVSDILMEMLDGAKKSRSSQGADALGETLGSSRTGTNPALMNLPMISPVKGQSLYPVPEGTPEAWVAPEWSADAVSDRIIQLAGFFMATLPGDPEENIKKIKDAMEKGFQNANEAIGSVPADLAQLYNNTYTKTMEKWDAVVGEFRSSMAADSKIDKESPELVSGQWTRPVGI